MTLDTSITALIRACAARELAELAADAAWIAKAKAELRDALRVFLPGRVH
jgi:hypothetical protein